MNSEAHSTAAPLVASVHESGEQPRSQHSPSPELARDSLVAGKYRVRELLGRGGFALVYAAEHVSLGREVALKVLHRTDTTHAVLLERFSREMRISALVRHPHVLEVYDAGTLEDGSPFLVMEKIAGETLQARLDRVSRLALEDVVELCSQLLWALVALAERGIVHRDIKPENLMLTESEGGRLHLKLVDFGISLVRQEPIDGRLTRSGTLIGTPHYMAPEQLRSELVDARVDVYATGVVLYQALTGRMPYDGEDLSSLTLNVLNGEAPAIPALRPDCPADLARLVERALARSPQDRYPDAASMLADLLACRQRASATPALPRPSEAPLPGLDWVQAHLRHVLMALGVVLGGLYVGLAERGVLHAAPESGTSQLSTRHEQDDTLLTGAGEAASAPDNAAALPGAAPPFERSAQAHSSGDAARALARRALVLYLHGDSARAYTLYQRALEAQPDEPSALRGLGLSAARLGRKDEARRAYARYLQLAPDAADARAVRARLTELAGGGSTR